jgi:hypothetical protein
MTTMKEVMQAGEAVATAYGQLLAASDALADLMQYSREHVLRRVITTKPCDRRDPNKVLEYLEAEYRTIEQHLKDVAKVHAQAAARKELLGRLNLSAAELKLLGIETKSYDQI